MSEDGGDGGEMGGGIGECGMHRILCLIKWIAIHGETLASSSSFSDGGEIKGLVSSPALPSFL